MNNFENFDKAVFKGVGKYDIPLIKPETELPSLNFISMNYALTAKHRAKLSVHCFVDDYQFIRYWQNPERYASLLKDFDAVLSPDFSLYTDMPMAMQIYNHYRKHWLAAYWQSKGARVYPTITWSDGRSYSWCFDGEPTESVVAVSSVGTQRDKDAMRLFLNGYNFMKYKLNPKAIIFYGKIPEECLKDNVVAIEPHYKAIRNRTIKKEESVV